MYTILQALAISDDIFAIDISKDDLRYVRSGTIVDRVKFTQVSYLSITDLMISDEFD